MSALTIRDYGDRALLIECASTHEVLAVADALREAELPGITDIVPGARTVLVALTEPAHQAPTRTRLADIEVSAAATSVRPDGPTS
jgi:allophanate hydrolase subunit 1